MCLKSCSSTKYFFDLTHFKLESNADLGLLVSPLSQTATARCCY
jgi:hypothetical protein